MKKRIKRMMKNGLIIPLAFSVFFGCTNLLTEPHSTVVFELDARLPLDDNGYYHLEIDTTTWQTLHRLSGHVYRDGDPVNIVKFGWGSSHYWVVGDNFGYVIANNGLTDDLVYVGYDTTYLDWFGGSEVPIVNGASYSRDDGEVNTMLAPVYLMRGDTSTIYYGYLDNYYGDEYSGEFYVIFD